MSRPWTNNQKLAINARNGSLLVSAAAGSGKTAVLVERVVQMVSDSKKPVPIERLLIVTYTRAAAAELKERIYKTLNELILEHPENKWYRRQLMYLPKANISTVDSFCGDVVREFFQTLNIPRDYRIADDSELSIVKEDAMERTLEHFYAQGSSEFHHLVEAFASPKNDDVMKDNIYLLYKFLRSHPFEDRWLDEKLSYFTEFTTVSDSVWGKVVIDYAESAVEYCLDVTNSSIELAKEEPELYEKIAERLGSDKTYLEAFKTKLQENADWDTLFQVANTFSAGRFEAKGFTDHPLKVRIGDTRKKTVEIIRSIIDLFAEKEENIKAQVLSQINIVSKMFECVRVFSKYYYDAKLAKNIADFSDIVHWTLDLLVKCDDKGNPVATDIAKIISDRFDEVMVDEFQDANEVQDMIFNAVSHNGTNLFIVGDVKQSIYGFRQAMPEIFLSRKNSLDLYDDSKDNYPAKVILECNFRSRREVTDFVNFVFSTIMSTQVGDMEYTKEEHLEPAAKYTPATSPCNELHLLDLDEIGDMDAALAEARYIASLIYEKCKTTKIKDGDSERNLRFGDIAILMRFTNTYGELYANELRRYGIPTVTETSSGFLCSEEIVMVTDILRVIDNPLQDIPLMSALMSPVFGFTVDDITTMRMSERKIPLYMSLVNFAKSGNPKAQKFIETIDSFRRISITMTSDAFLGALYTKTGLLYLAKAIGGEVAFNNLCLLKEYAAEYEKGSTKGISSFISYIDKLVVNGKDLSAATSTNPDSGNVVRIMTIHSSKGLEFPLCILANTSREFKSDINDDILLHSKLGFASKARDEELMCTYDTFARQSVALEISRNERSEEIRVLYVALTRAKEQLVMIATKKNLRRYVTNLGASLADTTKISPFTLRSSRFLSDWIVLIALMHPAAENLRNFADMEKKKNFACADTGNFQVKIIDNLDYDFSSANTSVTTKTVYDDLDEDYSAILKERFDNFSYPNADLCTLPQKVTASELTHKSSVNYAEVELPTPRFLSDSPLTAAERGTAMHTFMQYCDFAAAKQDVKAEAERLVSSGRLTRNQADSLNLPKLSAFLSSDIVSLALASGEYYKEYRFTVNIPAYMVDENISFEASNHSVILQGAVDLAIIDNDGIIIVDYKTDRVKSMDVLKSRYEKQLNLYKAALEQTTGKPVKKSLIYSINLSESLEV